MKTKANKTAKAAKATKKSNAPTSYQKNVLAVNKELKRQNKSLGGCRSTLLNMAKEINLNPLFVKLLKDSKEAENYKVLQTFVRTSKAGNYCPFYVLQALNKHSDKLQNAFAENAKKAKAAKAKGKKATKQAA